MKFMLMVWAAFFARQKPDSTIAKPACMNMTRKPQTSVHTKLIAILLCPTVSITSGSVGCAASFTVTSLAVPVVAPVGSPAGAAWAACALTVSVVIAGANASVTPIANAILQKRPARLLIPVPSHGLVWTCRSRASHATAARGWREQDERHGARRPARSNKPFTWNGLPSREDDRARGRDQAWESTKMSYWPIFTTSLCPLPGAGGPGGLGRGARFRGRFGPRADRRRRRRTFVW